MEHQLTADDEHLLNSTAAEVAAMDEVTFQAFQKACLTSPPGTTVLREVWFEVAKRNGADAELLAILGAPALPFTDHELDELYKRDRSDVGRPLNLES